MDTNLLKSLRAAISGSLNETSTAAIVGNYYGKGPKGTRKRRKLYGVDAVDKLSRRSGVEEGLGEVASMFMESRARVRAAGRYGSREYASVLGELDCALEFSMPVEVLTEIHGKVIPLIREDVGLSGTPCSGECEAVHKKFVKALESEFGVEVGRWDPIAGGLYAYLNAEDTNKLGIAIMELRDFADDKGYILIKKGTTEDQSFRAICCDESLWVFVYDENHHTELGEFE